MHKESFIINRTTLLHVSTLLGHLQGELFCYHYTKVALYSTRPGPQGVHASSTQYTVNSTFSLNYKVQP
jgi:hypothetical protein